MTLIVFDGIPLEIPKKFVNEFPIDKYTYDSFPDSFCGAGNGLFEKIVPDYIFGITRIFSKGFLASIGLSMFDISIKISPACWIHDMSWYHADATVVAFNDSNILFENNISSIIMNKCSNEFIRARALYRAVTYHNAVMLHGKRLFWSMKAAQGNIIADSALQFVDNDLVYMLKKEMEAA